MLTINHAEDVILKYIKNTKTCCKMNAHLATRFS